MNKRKDKRLNKTTKLLAAFIISLPVLLAGITTHPESASAASFEAQGEEDGLIAEPCIPLDVFVEHGTGGVPFCPAETEPEEEPYPYDPYTRGTEDLEQCLSWSGGDPVLTDCPDGNPQDSSELCYESVYSIITLHRVVPCAPPDNPDDPDGPDENTDRNPIPPESVPVRLDFNSATKHDFSVLSANAPLFGYSECPNGAISYGRECGAGTIFRYDVPGDAPDGSNRARQICTAADNRARNSAGFREYRNLEDHYDKVYDSDGKVSLDSDGNEIFKRRFNDQGLLLEGYYGIEYPVNTNGDRVEYELKGAGDCVTRGYDALVKSAFPEGQVGSLQGFTELADSLKDADPADRRFAIVSVRTFCPSNEALVGADVQKVDEMIKYHHLWRDRSEADIESLKKGLEHDSFRVCVFSREKLKQYLEGAGKTEAQVAADVKNFDDRVYGRPTYVYVEDADICIFDLADYGNNPILRDKRIRAGCDAAIQTPDYLRLIAGDPAGHTWITSLKQGNTDVPAPADLSLDFEIVHGHNNPDYVQTDDESGYTPPSDQVEVGVPPPVQTFSFRQGEVEQDGEFELGFTADSWYTSAAVMSDPINVVNPTHKPRVFFHLKYNNLTTGVGSDIAFSNPTTLVEICEARTLDCVNITAGGMNAVAL